MNNSNTKSVKLGRVFAYILDIIFSLIITFILIFIAIAILGYSGEASSNPDSFKYIVGILELFPFLLIFRDFIFGGRSLGKRILKLRINDFTTGKKPKVTKTAFRGFLTVFILPLELIYLLAEGRTIGDRIANTVVISSSTDSNSKLSNLSPKRSITMKVTIAVVCIILLLSVVLVPMILALNSETNDPQYALAYDYFANSDSFEFFYEETDIIECKELNTDVEFSHDGNIEATKEFIFTVNNGSEFSVILHSENGNWYLCDECIRFY